MSMIQSSEWVHSLTQFKMDIDNIYFKLFVNDIMADKIAVNNPAEPEASVVDETTRIVSVVILSLLILILIILAGYSIYLYFHHKQIDVTKLDL